MTLAEALRHPNVQAFLRMLRHGEGTTDADGYRRMFGGKLFDSFADHPRKAQSATLSGNRVLTSTAAGAYQFLSKTWTSVAFQCGLKDFSPESQDLGAVALIRGRGALDDVIAGRFNQAVGKCNREWASLPGAPYGQPTVSMDRARALYEAAGGNYDAMHAPVQTTQKVGGEPVNPFLLAAIPSLLEAVPKLVSIFGSGSEVSQRNAKAIETVVEIAKAATGATNEQDLTERLQDPIAIEQVKAAIETNWFQLQEIGGGVAGARKADVAFVDTGRSPFVSPVFLVTMMLLPLVYMSLYAVLYRVGFSDEMKAMVLGTVFGGLLVGGIQAYFYGTSASSARKTELQAQGG